MKMTGENIILTGLAAWAEAFAKENGDIGSGEESNGTVWVSSQADELLKSPFHT